MEFFCWSEAHYLIDSLFLRNLRPKTSSFITPLNIYSCFSELLNTNGQSRAVASRVPGNHPIPAPSKSCFWSSFRARVLVTTLFHCSFSISCYSHVFEIGSLVIAWVRWLNTMGIWNMAKFSRRSEWLEVKWNKWHVSFPRHCRLVFMATQLIDTIVSAICSIKCLLGAVCHN